MSPKGTWLLRELLNKQPIPMLQGGAPKVRGWSPKRSPVPTRDGAVFQQILTMYRIDDRRSCSTDEGTAGGRVAEITTEGHPGFHGLSLGTATGHSSSGERSS